MAAPHPHRILIATDGSPPAEAALATAAKFSWPSSAQARAVIASASWLIADSEIARAAIARSFDAAATAARKTLARRWPDSEAVIIDAPPVEAILTEAQRFEASVIVLGWRGHGTFKRLLAGSVSRAIAANAQCSVLVVRTAPQAVRRVVVGYDGCANAERALDLLSSLEPKRGSRVTLVNVVDPIVMPASASALPTSVRANIRREMTALNEERYRQGQAIVAAGAKRLERSGWTAKSEVRVGAPLLNLLKAAEESRADLLVLGARAISGLERALLGSVANGALNRSTIPVLLVR